MTLLTRIAQSNGNSDRKKVARRILNDQGMKNSNHKPRDPDDSTAQAKAGAKHRSNPQPVPRKRILIVDDTDSMRIILETYLNFISPDYQVVTAPNGFIALTRFREQPFDLVITDYSMPFMNGLDLILALRRQAPTLPIILMTAAVHLSLRQTAEQMDNVSFFEKPFPLAKLGATLKTFFGTGQGKEEAQSCPY